MVEVAGVVASAAKSAGEAMLADTATAVAAPTHVTAVDLAWLAATVYALPTGAVKCGKISCGKSCCDNSRCGNRDSSGDTKVVAMVAV